MTPSREDLELYVTGNYDGDVAALERAIAEDPKLAAIVAEEAHLDMLLRDAAADATFCAACDELVRDARCDACGAALRPGGYVVERVLRKSGHGRMYLARDADGKQVALKELAFLHAPSAAALAAFEREAKFLRALEHPAIPRFCAAFEEGSGVHTRYYLAQELVAGRALDHLDDHWYSEAEIVAIAKQVLGVLVYLQSLSPMVIHRDIKPANLIQRADGSIAVVDFGAAHVHGTTAGSTTIGTFGYMPTEQLAGIVDATTDLYALGASLLYLLTRQEPWRLAQTKTSVNVSAPLRAFLDKLTATDPRARFQSAAEALRALEQRELGKPKPTRRWWPTKRALAIAAAAMVIGGGTFGVVHHLNEEDEYTKVPPIGYGIATVKISMPEGIQAEMIVDGFRVATVTNNSPGIPVGGGVRHIKLLGSNGLSCDDPHVKLKGGETTTLECNFGLSPDEQMRKLREFKNKMCACKDAVCAQTVADAMRRWADTQPKKRPQIADSEMKAATALGEEMGQCMARLTGNATTLPVIAPSQPQPPEPSALDFKRRVSWDYEKTPFHDVVPVVAKACAFNFVVPDFIQPRVTMNLSSVPCNQALEVLLESHGLWFDYNPHSKLLRIATRKDLEEDRKAAHARPSALYPPLPEGKPVSLDFKQAPIHDVIKMLAVSQGMNIVVPDSIDSKVSIRVNDVDWRLAFEAVLEANGLWYRYRTDSKIVRVAPRKDLEEEDKARGSSK